MTGPTVPWSKTRCLGAHCQKLTFQHALSLPVQNVHVAPRCALVRRTDRWGTRLGGLDRNKSAQDQRGVLTSQRFSQRSRIMCHIDRPNSRAVSGGCCGMWCSTRRRHHARTARARHRYPAVAVMARLSPACGGAERGRGTPERFGCGR